MGLTGAVILWVFFFLSAVICPEEGYASWYGPKFHGRKTASGEIYDMHKLTAAHKTLPFGTYVLVVNLENGFSVVVKINDRGPFVKGRIIDLSKAAAIEIGMIKSGTARVRIEKYNPAKKTHQSIQVGSYSEHDNALSVQAELKENGIISVIEKSPSGTHRIIIRHVSAESLETVKKKLSDMGFHDYIIKQEKLTGS
ncbi:MAG: septal ring lytic transglycosylase RlpA family protein [Spirochaetales bacterium]|nr:septal ring lytic transglycosylase RlpA family protein [Spirochaetales bacterium]